VAPSLFHRIAWGDVPTWIALGGAIAAAVAALIQLHLQREETARQTREFARRTRVLEREQADAVDFSWIPANPQQITIVTAHPLPAAARSVLCVNNKSRRPIRDVACRINTPDGQLDAEGVGPLDPGDPPQISSWVITRVPLIRAGVTFGFLFERALDAGLPPQNMRLVMRFNDDAGLHWQIDQDLHLEKLDLRDW
jgi:hypothetical protein